MTVPDLERLILQHVNRPGYHPVKPRVIAKKLDLPLDSHTEVRRVVKRLVREGKLAYGEKHLIRPPDEGDKSQFVGKFRRTGGGYGFARPLNARRSDGRDSDIYIAADTSLDAADDDIVLVKVTRKQRGREIRASGKILEILERSTHQFVGTYFEEHEQGYVKVDAGIFEQPIRVGDAGAKNARVDDKVVIEIVRFPKVGRSGEGVITEVLGDRNKPGVDTQTIIYEFALPGRFSEEAMQDARAQAEAFDESIADGRRDLTDMTIITIDPQDARDFDDAISLEKIENDHWRLGVHIADVSHFIKQRSHLENESRDRATSIYLPDRVIPMLPEIISNNLASLQPDCVRYTMSVFIEYTPSGSRIIAEPCRAAIRSKRRFTYEEVDEFLEKPQVWKRKLKPEVFTLLTNMYRLARILRKRRMDRGSIELSMREVKLDLDKHGKVTGAHRTENTESHQIIEEFMLAANEAVAERLADDELHFLRRAHESPDPRKLRKLTEFVNQLGIECESLEDRFEIKRVLAEAAERPEVYAINYAVLRSMQKAVYTPEDIGHFALASKKYCHFTSPIRRYPDLQVHRLLGAVIDGTPPDNDFSRLAQLGDHCSQREQRAEKAERELTKLKLLNYLSDKIGTLMPAVITGVESYGAFALGLELPAEGLVAIDSLDDYFDYDDVTHTLRGRRGQQFRLGDTIEVEIASVDTIERRLDLHYVKHLDGGGRPSRTNSKKKIKKSATRSSKKSGKKSNSGVKRRSKKKPRPRKKKRK